MESSYKSHVLRVEKQEDQKKLFYGRKGFNSFAYIEEEVSCLIEIDIDPLLVLEMGWVTGV